MLRIKVNPKKAYEASTAALKLFDVLATIAAQGKPATHDQRVECMGYIAQVTKISPNYLSKSLGELLSKMAETLTTFEQLAENNTLRERLLAEHHANATLISCAITSDQVDVVRELLAAGVNPNTQVFSQVNVEPNRENVKKFYRNGAKDRITKIEDMRAVQTYNALAFVTEHELSVLGVLVHDKRTKATDHTSLDRARTTWNDMTFEAHSRVMEVLGDSKLGLNAENASPRRELEGVVLPNAKVSVDDAKAVLELFRGAQVAVKLNSMETKQMELIHNAEAINPHAAQLPLGELLSIAYPNKHGALSDLDYMQKWGTIYTSENILAFAWRHQIEGLVGKLFQKSVRLNHGEVALAEMRRVDTVAKTSADNEFVTRLTPEYTSAKTALQLMLKMHTLYKRPDAKTGRTQFLSPQMRRELMSELKSIAPADINLSCEELLGHMKTRACLQSQKDELMALQSKLHDSSLYFKDGLLEQAIPIGFVEGAEYLIEKGAEIPKEHTAVFRTTRMERIMPMTSVVAANGDIAMARLLRDKRSVIARLFGDELTRDFKGLEARTQDELKGIARNPGLSRRLVSMQAPATVSVSPSTANQALQVMEVIYSPISIDGNIAVTFAELRQARKNIKTLTAQLRELVLQEDDDSPMRRDEQFVDKHAKDFAAVKVIKHRINELRRKLQFPQVSSEITQDQVKVLLQHEQKKLRAFEKKYPALHRDLRRFDESEQRLNQYKEEKSELTKKIFMAQSRADFDSVESLECKILAVLDGKGQEPIYNVGKIDIKVQALTLRELINLQAASPSVRGLYTELEYQKRSMKDLIDAGFSGDETLLELALQHGMRKLAERLLTAGHMLSPSQAARVIQEYQPDADVSDLVESELLAVIDLDSPNLDIAEARLEEAKLLDYVDLENNLFLDMVPTAPSLDDIPENNLLLDMVPTAPSLDDIPDRKVIVLPDPEPCKWTAVAANSASDAAVAQSPRASLENVSHTPAVVSGSEESTQQRTESPELVDPIVAAYSPGELGLFGASVTANEQIQRATSQVIASTPEPSVEELFSALAPTPTDLPESRTEVAGPTNSSSQSHGIRQLAMSGS